MRERIAIVGVDAIGVDFAHMLANKLEVEIIGIEEAQMQNESYIQYERVPQLAMPSFEPKPSKRSIKIGCDKGHNYEEHREEDGAMIKVLWKCGRCGKMI